MSLQFKSIAWHPLTNTGTGLLAPPVRCRALAMTSQGPRDRLGNGTQHYVPQFLLRNFCGKKKSRCFVFDKYDGRVFETNVRNVASEHGFYDVVIADFAFTIDPVLQGLEAVAAESLQKIIRHKNLKILSEDERATIAQFAAVQMVRGSHSRVHLVELSRAIERELRSRGIDPQQVEGFSTLTPHEAKLLSIKRILEADEFVSHLYGKDWLLYQTDRTSPLFISDNPVARQNLREQGSLGIGVPGVEIYLPISTTLSLVFLCCSWREACSDAIERYEDLRRRIPTTPQFDLSPLKVLVEAVESGNPLNCSAGNVENMNSLQVKNAERFIFSSTDDFSLVRAMLAKSSRYRHGPRPHVF